MRTIIKWHETAKELPQKTKYSKTFKNGKTIEWEVEEPLLVIFKKENRIKPSRYFPKTDTWEGHTKDEIPEYWVTIKELNWIDEDD